MLPLLLYAETHYRFRYFFSLLKKREPEIVADSPHRLEPGHKLPILLLIKDAHDYPIVLRTTTVTITQHDGIILQKELLKKPQRVDQKWWWQVFHMEVTGISGWISINVNFEFEVKGKVRSYRNDNYLTSSKKPLSVFVSDEPLPRLPGMAFGDAHTHSHYTDDQVEYGSPPGVSQMLAGAMGLSFFCVTDHSYDLDDSVDNYLVNDPNVSKWAKLKQDIERLNKNSSDVVVIRGEEVSCRNHRDRNVHLLLLGDKNFFHGSGDGAERWFRTWCEHSVANVIQNKESASLAFAAHPLERVPFLQRLLLRRDEWKAEDWEIEGIKGLQFLNGVMNKSFIEGKNAWVQSLLKGHRIYLLGGNDAHGNFNRFRQIGIPFFSIRESNDHLFGKMRTGVILNGAVNVGSILNALRLGCHVITDGPVASMKLRNPRTAASIGQTIKGKNVSLEIEAASSREFGTISDVRLYQGIIGGGEETLLSQESTTGEYRIKKELTLQIDRRCYIRLEVATSPQNTFDQQTHFCLTNPIWIEPR